jgi:hypothetical protein
MLRHTLAVDDLRRVARRAVSLAAMQEVDLRRRSLLFSAYTILIRTKLADSFDQAAGPPSISLIGWHP